MKEAADLIDVVYRIGDSFLLPLDANMTWYKVRPLNGVSLECDLNWLYGMRLQRHMLDVYAAYSVVLAFLVIVIRGCWVGCSSAWGALKAEYI